MFPLKLGCCVCLCVSASESYNFSTALRQGFLQSLGSSVFYYPLALLFPIDLFIFHRTWNTLYQVSWTTADALGTAVYVAESHRVIVNALHVELLWLSYAGYVSLINTMCVLLRLSSGCTPLSFVGWVCWSTC